MIVKDRAAPGIGAITSNELHWATINWRTVMQKVKNLRRRICRATQAKQWNRVRSLMKLMLRSRMNLLESVRRITQLNAGKKTPGIDGKTATTAWEREKLIREMSCYQPWKVKPAKRIYIPKANGKKRPIGIICLTDRVAQAMVKNALEPSWEARFEACTYGFRPGRRVQDALERVWYNFRSKMPNQWALDADIQSAFDQVCHTHLMDKIGKVPGRTLILRWLKAGYVEQGHWYATHQGTGQGSVISPLLLNIALHGLNTWLSQFKRSYEYTLRIGINQGKKRWHEKPRYYLTTYADDLVISTQTREAAEAIISPLNDWLKERGLQLNSEKTRIVHIDKGFNFLGTTIRRYKGKCLIKPQKEKVIQLLKRLRVWLKKNQSGSQLAIIEYFNPILRGWGNFYRTQCSKKVFSYIDHCLWKTIWKWCLRRHPNKGKDWVKNKYFHTINERQWVFAAKKEDRKCKSRWMRLIKVSDIQIKRHSMIKGNASPEDPNLKGYWKKRQLNNAKRMCCKEDRFSRVINRQRGFCPVCYEDIFNGERIHLHHKIPIKRGGGEEVNNLVWLHQICHQQVHSSKQWLEQLKA